MHKQRNISKIKVFFWLKFNASAISVDMSQFEKALGISCKKEDSCRYEKQHIRSDECFQGVHLQIESWHIAILCSHCQHGRFSRNDVVLTFMELQLVQICFRLLGLSSFSFPLIRFLRHQFIFDRPPAGETWRAKVVQSPENSGGKYFVQNAATRNWMHGSDMEKRPNKLSSHGLWLPGILRNRQKSACYHQSPINLWGNLFCRKQQPEISLIKKQIDFAFGSNWIFSPLWNVLCGSAERQKRLDALNTGTNLELFLK